MFDGVAETPNLPREEHLGNGFLLRQGYTLAWCVWQWDVMRVEGMLGTGVPQATAGAMPRRDPQSNYCVCMALQSRLRRRRVSVSSPMMCNHPSPSVIPSREVYRELVRKVAEALIAEGYLLPADLDEIVQRAIWRYNLCTTQS
jgi:hypothetical protein